MVHTFGVWAGASATPSPPITFTFTFTFTCPVTWQVQRSTG